METARHAGGSGGLAASRVVDIEISRPRENSRILAFLLHERADTLAEQGDIKRLLESFVEAVIDEGFGGSFVLASQRDDHGLLVGRVAAQVLSNGQALAAAHGQIDDDRIGMETLGLDAGL